jgi:hypothetical protein
MAMFNVLLVSLWLIHLFNIHGVFCVVLDYVLNNVYLFMFFRLAVKIGNIYFLKIYIIFVD